MTEYYTLGTFNSSGVPNYLHEIAQIPPNLMSRIMTALPERGYVPTNSPEFLTNTAPRDILIKYSDESIQGVNVYMTFLYEGAGYRNVVGYYHYPLNGEWMVPTKFENGEYVPMTYADRNTTSGGKSILKKTIVFPNASLPTWSNNNGTNSQAGGGNLLPGSKVKLLYDPSNPDLPFPNNTGIGFFLIPNGWNGSRVTNAGERVHTGNVFNLNGSVQTVLLFDSQDSDEYTGKMVIAFEDIMRPGGDHDFNDVIIQLEYDPIYAVINSGNIVLPTSNPITEDKIIIDKTGMYLQLKNSSVDTYYNTPGLTHLTCKQTITINDPVSKSDLQRAFNNFTKENNAEYIDIDTNTCQLKINIPRENIQNYNYFFISYKNTDKTTVHDEETSSLVDFQNVYVYDRKGILGNQQFTLCKNNSDATKFVDIQQTPTVESYNSPYALGDPHVTTIYGDRFDLKEDAGIYELYNDGDIIINGHIDRFKRNEGLQLYENLLFFKYISIIHNGEHIISHMYHVDTHYKMVDNELIQIESHPYFNLYKPDDVSDIARKSINEYERLLDTRQFELRYIHIKTVKLGNIYVELMHIPHRHDVVSCVKILGDGLMMNNAKGLFVNKLHINKKYNLLD